MTEAELDALLLAEDASQLSDAQVAYLRDHPEIMEMIGDRKSLSARHLWRILAVAVLLVALSKLLVARFEDVFDQLLADMAVDLVFEMGAALIGSVATVIFIQSREKKQFLANLKFRANLQRRIASLDAGGQKQP